MYSLSLCIHVAAHDVGANNTFWLQECPACISALSSSPGMTISYFCHDTKRRWGRGSKTQRHNDANFLKIVWKCPLSDYRFCYLEQNV